VQQAYGKPGQVRIANDKGEIDGEKEKNSGVMALVQPCTQRLVVAAEMEPQARLHCEQDVEYDEEGNAPAIVRQTLQQHDNQRVHAKESVNREALLADEHEHELSECQTRHQQPACRGLGCAPRFDVQPHRRRPEGQEGSPIEEAVREVTVETQKGLDQVREIGGARQLSFVPQRIQKVSTTDRERRIDRNAQYQSTIEPTQFARS